MSSVVDDQPKTEILYTISPRRMQDLPAAERPREMFDRDGAANVSDRTLLAILLRSGVRGTSVVDLADKLLAEYGSISSLARAKADDLAAIHGMGRVKAQIIEASLELARRYATHSDPAPVSVRTPEEAARLFRRHVPDADQESFWMFALDVKHRLRRPPIEISKGILDACLVHPREVFREAIRACSAAIVIAHNHPSGDPTPSNEDIRLTRKLVEVGRIMEIDVLDHVILGRRVEGQAKDFLSLRESGLVEFGR